ncbi:MAG: hypothetical protein U9Q04_07680 [Campylobacterota bacterium]|nr:hypothetical protein [Campylobacterota bacterium]
MKSFTLFEVLISTIILSITISLLIKISHEDNTNESYAQLQTMENSFIETNNIQNTQNIKFEHH